MNKFRAKYALLLAAALIAVFLPLSVSLKAQQAVDLTGKVANKTAGGQLPSSLTIALRIVSLNGSSQDFSATSDATGQFSFNGVPVTTGSLYGIQTIYKNVAYTLEFPSFPPTDPVELAIYETGAPSSAVQFDNNTVIIGWADPTQKVLGVMENISITNSSDRTFVYDPSQPTSMDILRFSLPATYDPSSLDIQSNLGEGQAVPVDKGFGLSTPVPPGHYQILFTYTAAYQGSGLSFTRTFPFGTKTFTLLMPENMAKLTAPGLINKGVMDVGGTNFTQWEGTGYTRDSRLDISIGDLPQPTLFERTKNTLWGGTTSKIVTPTVAALLLVTAIAAIILLRRRKTATPQLATEAVLSREALVASIANLDETFEKGEIEKDEYERRRGLLKERLLEQTKEEPTDSQTSSS